MSASICVFILTCSTLCGSTVVSGALSAPKNVRLTSDNMDLVLRWESPEVADDGLIYTAEFKTTVAPYRVGCLNVSTPECDISSRFPVTEYGKYTARVRAQSGAESSAWVESDEIVLDKDTVIGSPNISLFSNGPTIEVSITDPAFATSSLRDVYISAVYNISYWKAGEKEKEVNTINDAQQNRVVLDKLDPWSEYCVQVQINTKRNLKPSKPSTTLCERTTNDEEAPWVAAVLTFVAMATAVAVVVVAVLYWKRISNFLCPKDTLPQYLLAPAKSPIYLAMRNSHPPEEIYHQVSIVAYDRTVEEGRHLEAAGSGSGCSCSGRQPEVAAGER